ncbi:TPA: hypothetical protein EYP66_20750 [Candidatus Poribacteria bacterium]|nr:hypothetical protein [Candidatus Poribacteria bacterium]
MAGRSSNLLLNDGLFFRDLNELVLAYAITVHKSQGSEYKAVVIPISICNFVLRNA